MTKYIWNLDYTGKNSVNELIGDQLILLLTRREYGVFIRDEDQPDGIPNGWVFGELKTQTKGAMRLLCAKVIARDGGQWYWISSNPGTRIYDYATWAGYRVVVEAYKPHADSWFASQLEECNWTLTSEDVFDGEIESVAVLASISRDISLSLKQGPAE